MKIYWFSLALILLAATADKPGGIRGGNGVSLPAPPSTTLKPMTDSVNGTTIADPYRWLEDSQSPATRAWIESQVRYTQEYLSQLKIRPAIAKRLTELVRVEEYGVPVERRGQYFFTKRMADENQASIYIRNGLHGSDERLIDATKLSADQNTSVQIDDITKDGALLAYGVREGGADEEAVHLLDVTQRREMPDVLPRARYDQISLSPDKKGVYYAKDGPTGPVVYNHRLGTAADSDQFIFGKQFGQETYGPM